MALPCLVQGAHLSSDQMARLSEVRLSSVQAAHPSMVLEVRLSLVPEVQNEKVQVVLLSLALAVLNEKAQVGRIEMDREVFYEFVRRLLPLLPLRRWLHSVDILCRLL